MSQIQEAIENEIMEELINIMQGWIQIRVYGRPQGPSYYERTNQLYNAVDLKIFQKTDNSIAFSLFVNVDKLNPVKRDGLDAYAAESGQYILSKIPRMVNRGSNLPAGQQNQAPRFFEKTHEEILSSNVIERLLIERLEKNEWVIKIT